LIRKRHSTNTNKVIVTFEIPDSVWAERINLVGDFNDWDRDNLPFRRTRGGNWKIEVEIDQGREYHFRYLLDDVHWRYDWHADNHASNPQGGYDSIVVAELLPSTIPPEAP
jgi:1,4-alpha-glucan branching enzyme